MLARFPFFGLSLLALMSGQVDAGISFELTSHSQITQPKPPAFQPRLRSRPRRLDSESESDIQTRQSPTLSHVPLNSYDSGGLAYTIEVEVAGSSFSILVSLLALQLSDGD